MNALFTCYLPDSKNEILAYADDIASNHAPGALGVEISEFCAPTTRPG